MNVPRRTDGEASTRRIDSYDGLRAVAVMAVIAFHSRLGLAPGGYLGVDVFFVLSGFLITGLLLRETATDQRIDLIAFWFRRVRRLVPAALVAIVGSSVMFALVATNPARQAAIPDARAASLWYANWHFIGEAQDYFRGGVDDSPFLHFWSLSVEEQFYVVWPIAVLAALTIPGLRRLLRRRTAIVAVPLLAAVYAYVAAGVDPLRAYYATDTRIYQLLAGAALAAWFARYGPRSAPTGIPEPMSVLVDRGATTVGSLASLAEWTVIAVIGAWLFVDEGISPRDAGAIVTLLTVWVLFRLAPDSPGHRASAVTALLSRPTPVRIGRLSYGIYLWHWPVIVVAGRLVEMSAPVRFTVAVTGAFALASASWMFVEQPVQHVARRIRRRRGRLTSIGLAITSSVLVAVVAVPVALSDQLPLLRAVERPGFTPLEQTSPSLIERRDTTTTGDARAAAPADGEAAESTTPRTSSAPSSLPPEPTGTPVPDGFGLIDYDTELAESSKCVLDVGDDADACIVVANGGPRILVVGDSHAARLAPAFTDVARRNGGTVATVLGLGCPWQTTMLYENYADADEERQCRRVHDDVLDVVVPGFEPDVIVAVGHPVLEPGWRARAADGNGEPLAADGLRDVSAASLAEFASVADGAELVVVRPLPSAPYGPLECLDVADTVEQCDFAVGDATIQEWVAIDAAVDTEPTARSASVHELACPATTFCGAIVDGVLVRNDRDHLYYGFVQRHADEIVQRILDG